MSLEDICIVASAHLYLSHFSLFQCLKRFRRPGKWLLSSPAPHWNQCATGPRLYSFCRQERAWSTAGERSMLLRGVRECAEVPQSYHPPPKQTGDALGHVAQVPTVVIPWPLPLNTSSPLVFEATSCPMSWSHTLVLFPYLFSELMAEVLSPIW